MVLKGEIQQEDFFELEILEKNKIPGILPLKIMKKDESLCFWYSITGRESLQEFLSHRQVDYFVLELLLESINQTMKEIADYLMDEENIVLQPEQIYLDLSGQKAEFSYFPGCKCFHRKAFQGMMEMILKNLNHKDKKASALSYAIYQMSVEQKLPLEEMLEKAFLPEHHPETEILHTESLEQETYPPMEEYEDSSKNLWEQVKEWIKSRKKN